LRSALFRHRERSAAICFFLAGDLAVKTRARSGDRHKQAYRRPPVNTRARRGRRHDQSRHRERSAAICLLSLNKI